MTLKTAIPPREGQVLSCCLCMTAPGVLFTQHSVCWCRHPVLVELFFQDSSRWQGTGWSPCSLGGSSPEIPLEGIFLSPSTPSFWPHSHPCLIVSVVPSLYPYYAWFVLLMFQTGSLTVSYLKHRRFQIFLLCCACSHALPKYILPAPALVRVLFQKHASLACSCLSQPCSDCSLAHLCPALYQTLIHFPPRVWVQLCVLPCPSQTSTCSSLCPCQSFSSGHAPFIHHGRNKAMIFQRKTISAATSEGSRRQTAPNQCHDLKPSCSEMLSFLEQIISSRALGRTSGIIVFIERFWNLSHEVVAKSMVPIYNPWIWPCCSQRRELLEAHAAKTCHSLQFPQVEEQDQAVLRVEKQHFTQSQRTRIPALAPLLTWCEIATHALPSLYLTFFIYQLKFGPGDL